MPGELGDGTSDGEVLGRNSGNVTGVGSEAGVGRLGSGTDGLGLMEGVTSMSGSICGLITDKTLFRMSVWTSAEGLLMLAGDGKCSETSKCWNRS